jgi:hypothetical protein
MSCFLVILRVSVALLSTHVLRACYGCSCGVCDGLNFCEARVRLAVIQSASVQPSTLSAAPDLEDLKDALALDLQLPASTLAWLDAGSSVTVSGGSLKPTLLPAVQLA